MKSKELNAFEAKYGYKPTRIALAIDALAIYVNKDNPIKGLTIPQVDAIFSATRKCGYKDAVNEQPGSASVVQGVTKSSNKESRSPLASKPRDAGLFSVTYLQ